MVDGTDPQGGYHVLESEDTPEQETEYGGEHTG